MILRIASLVWGEKHTNMMNTYTMPSLAYDIDRLETEGVIVQHNKYESFEHLIEAECTFSLENHDTYCFFAAPDHIWSKNSLYNLIELSKNGNFCYSIPHFRINDIHEPVEFPIESKQLARFALDNAHEMFTTSFDDLDRTFCHQGMTARKLDEGIISMKHNLPSVFLAKFTYSDLEFFREVKYSIGQWDRGWLSRLCQEGRLKIIGSSELAFTVEMTSPELEAVGLWANRYSDAHYLDLDYQKISRMMIYGLTY